LAETRPANAPAWHGPYYKPAGSDGSENLYLADYLGMIGLPILPVAHYPMDEAVAFLPVQAGADPRLLENMRQHLKHGSTLVLTPALVRALGQAGRNWLGSSPGLPAKPLRPTRSALKASRLIWLLRWNWMQP